MPRHADQGSCVVSSIAKTRLILFSIQQAHTNFMKISRYTVQPYHTEFYKSTLTGHLVSVVS